jgi:peptidyl-prolyl cis-trans isomerase SurA
MRPSKWLIFPLFFAGLGVSVCAQTKSTVVEEIVARVNNEIITREDLEKARASLDGEARDACANCTPEKIRTMVESKEKDLLRDLIDQSLLTQRAKDDGINVDADVIKRLDAIRLQNKLPDMDALEKAIRDSGQDFEDFKTQLRDQLLTQELIRKEVGSKIIISHEDIVKYYNEHKTEFVRPETVVLREIFVSTEGKPEADLPALRKKALFGQPHGYAIRRTRCFPAHAARRQDRGQSVRPESQPDDRRHGDQNRI